MLFFDVTKSSRAAHRSGLLRVSERLSQELAARLPTQFRRVVWEGKRSRWSEETSGGSVTTGPGDRLILPEIFDPEERPGFAAYLEKRSARVEGLFYDNIPLRLPHLTWPRSVARHPRHVKFLSTLDRVWAISADSARDLQSLWKWMQVEAPPPVATLPLGADLGGRPRRIDREEASGNAPLLLQVGIVEPRKNTALTLAACEALWAEGRAFEWHVVGRVNPHFGQPIADALKTARRRGRPVFHHADASDAALDDLYRRAWATVFPSRAEGCGLPILESLWAGVPCVCSGLPVLREVAEGGGCLPVAVDDAHALTKGLRAVMAESDLRERLRSEAVSRPLPTWSETAGRLLAESPD